MQPQQPGQLPPSIAQALDPLLALLAPVDPDAEINSHHWAASLLTKFTDDKQRALLRDAAWANAAGEILTKAPWPVFQSPEDSELFWFAFREAVQPPTRTGAFWSHSFTTNTTPFTQDSVVGYFKTCFSLLDLLSLPDSTLWTTVQSGTLISVFDHTKGYANSAELAGDVVQAWPNLPKPDSGGSMSTAGLPKPSTLLATRFGRPWEKHPFTKAWSYNQVPAQALGDELTRYSPEQLRSCAVAIFLWLFNDLADQGSLPWTRTDRMPEYLNHNREDLEVGLRAIAGDQETARKLAAIVVTLDDSVYLD